MTLDLTDVGTLRNFLQQFGIRPTKALSQNFLVDHEALEEIVTTANLAASDDVLEVGAGTGVLTVALARRAKHVVAVEVDRNIIPLLTRVTQDCTNVEIVAMDVMRMPLAELHQKVSGTRPYRLVANLPYHLSSHFLQRFFDTEHGPASFTVLLQREVAERIAATPGNLSILALSVQFFGTPSVVAIVPAQAFWPAPSVESAILHIVRHPAPLFNAETRARIFRLAKIGFAGKRKTLANALSAGLRVPRVEIEKILLALDLKLTVRAQELTLEQWRGLAGKIDGERR